MLEINSCLKTAGETTMGSVASLSQTKANSPKAAESRKASVIDQRSQFGTRVPSMDMSNKLRLQKGMESSQVEPAPAEETL